MQNESPKTCFVIMPFTVKEPDRARYADVNHWNEVYQGLIAPAVDKAGLVCVRDDKDIGSRLIAEVVLQKIERADIILCDLSSHNANVFLELGWALRADKPFVLIKDDLTDYTFDLAQQYTFEYRHGLQPVGLGREVEKLAIVLRKTLEDIEQRYSFVRRMSLAFSTIKAVEGGDLQAGILSELQQRVAEIQKSVGARRPRPETFVWPELLKRGTRLLAAAKEKIESASATQPGVEVARLVADVAKSHGAQNSRDIQISLFDDSRKFVYHEWPDIIGKHASLFVPLQEPETLGDLYRFTSGAIAWADSLSNLPEHAFSQNFRRLNVGLFASIESRPGWRVFVETHWEVE